MARHSPLGYNPAVRRKEPAGAHARFAMSFGRSGVLGSVSLILFSVVFGVALMSSALPTSQGILVVANQYEHTALLVDPDARKEIAKIPVGINGHEVTVDKAGKFAYVPIYGNSGVG